MGVWGLIMTTTYTVTSKKKDNAFEFNYDLNGDLKAFKIIKGRLEPKQAKWLFSGVFPAYETIIKTVWLANKDITSKVNITVGEPDLSFETFYNAYKYKIKKLKAQKAWDKLSKADRIECLKSLKSYEGYLTRKQVAKANPEAYLNQRRWEDDFNSIH